MCAPANGARRTISPNVGSRASDGFPGQTIGIVGLGRIGTRVAQLLAPWRARIIAYDPYVPPAHFLTLTPVDYQTLLRESDVVSFHVIRPNLAPVNGLKSHSRRSWVTRGVTFHRRAASVHALFRTGGYPTAQDRWERTNGAPPAPRTGCYCFEYREVGPLPAGKLA